MALSGFVPQTRTPPECLKIFLEKVRTFGGRELGPDLGLCYHLAALEQRYPCFGFPPGLGDWSAPHPEPPAPCHLCKSKQGQASWMGQCACKSLFQIPAEWQVIKPGEPNGSRRQGITLHPPML